MVMTDNGDTYIHTNGRINVPLLNKSVLDQFYLSISYPMNVIQIMGYHVCMSHTTQI